MSPFRVFLQVRHHQPDKTDQTGCRHRRAAPTPSTAQHSTAQYSTEDEFTLDALDIKTQMPCFGFTQQQSVQGIRQ